MADGLEVADCSPSVNLALLTDGNQNLTGAEKVLLEWHYQFEHSGMKQVQLMLKKAAAKCVLYVCEICEFSKAHACPKKAFTMTKRITHDGSLGIDDLRPGSTVSVDHFESRLLGRTFNSYGGPSPISLLVGASLLTMYLYFFMWSIKLVSLQIWIMVLTIWRTMEFSIQMLFFNT